MKVTGNTLADWRIGTMRLEAVPSGKRWVTKSIWKGCANKWRRH
jgi:hypothetical protein